MQAPKQSRHPERSASQIYRNKGLYGAESKDPGNAFLTDALGSFSTAHCNGSHRLFDSLPQTLCYPTNLRGASLERCREICSSADFSWKRGIIYSNIIVISTGAQRTGEICGCLLILTQTLMPSSARALTRRPTPRPSPLFCAH